MDTLTCRKCSATYSEYVEADMAQLNCPDCGAPTIDRAGNELNQLAPRPVKTIPADYSITVKALWNTEYKVGILDIATMDKRGIDSLAVSIPIRFDCDKRTNESAFLAAWRFTNDWEMFEHDIDTPPSDEAFKAYFMDSLFDTCQI